MTDITLKPITRDNWKACIQLWVAEDQEKFVASNAFSLAQAAYEDNNYPMGIYHKDTMVGFLMYSQIELEGKKRWGIMRLMVDQQHQGKGYGRAGMENAIKLIREQHNPNDLLISYMPDNIAAEKLYASLGFINEGKIIYDEILVRLPFNTDNST